MSLLTLFLFTGCGYNEDFGLGQIRSHERVDELPADQLEKLAPTKIFRAVFNNSTKDIAEILKQFPEQRHSINANGDTPLGVSLIYGLHAPAQILARSISGPDLRHKNGTGQGYIFLAARNGFNDLILSLSNQHYGSLGWLNNFEFSDLDFPDVNGETALFVAANGKVAEALETQYYRGLLEMPFWRFTLHLNSEGQNFLHTAARDGRSDLILWASRRMCVPGTWETSTEWWQSYPASFLTALWKGFQTYLGNWSGPIDFLFNKSDHNGKTALHIALESRNFNSARALASCRWLDFDRTDIKNKLPLQSLVDSLNPFSPKVDKATKDLFEFILNQKTSLRSFYRSKADWINNPDAQGDTALHISARLADQYFYDRIKLIGDIHKPNAKGLTPQGIFAARRRELSRHGL